jgi:Zinc dependent phospholipase C
MPTPFYHLSLACDLQEDKAFPALLKQEWAAFCCGSIAPDAQTLTGQTRLSTHFFNVPMTDLTPAWESMFAQHPSLAQPSQLPPAQAAFLAGYLCHLALDQLWILHIFDPIFGEMAPWATFRERLFLHNVLRIHLDQLDVPKLQLEMGRVLKQAEPRHWLPFLPDEDIARWRDFVADQLVEGAFSQTIEVFAVRMSLPRTDFESLLQSSAEMEARIFSRYSQADLANYRSLGLARCLDVCTHYFSGQNV